MTKLPKPFPAEHLVQRPHRQRQITNESTHDGRPRVDDMSGEDKMLEVLREQHPERRPEKKRNMGDVEQELREALEQIEAWSQAYPLKNFPKPDYELARRLLEAGGMTLDAISADCIRDVLEGVGQIARQALATTREPTS
jgi:hypothetical protein